MVDNVIDLGKISTDEDMNLFVPVEQNFFATIFRGLPLNDNEIRVGNVIKQRRDYACWTQSLEEALLYASCDPNEYMEEKCENWSPVVLHFIAKDCYSIKTEDGEDLVTIGKNFKIESITNESYNGIKYKLCGVTLV